MAVRNDDATVQLKLRIPERLRAKIEAAAAISGISMNAEIIRRIEESADIDRRIKVAEHIEEYLFRATAKQRAEALQDLADLGQELDTP